MKQAVYALFLLIIVFVLAAIVSQVYSVPQEVVLEEPEQREHNSGGSEGVEVEEVSENTVPTHEVVAQTIVEQTVQQTLSGVPAQELANARRATVNMFCRVERDGARGIVSGTGVVIDPRGVVLTNAHLAQFFLVPDSAECSVRTGDPAEGSLEARIMYLPTAWVNENANTVAEGVPSGTGEDDYAFLYVAGVSGFPHVVPDPGASTGAPEDLRLAVGDPLAVVGYPSEFLSTRTVRSALYRLSAEVSINELFSFDDENHDTLDLISVGGSIVAQRGSSGSAVIGADGLLKGLVVTATTNTNLLERDLRAITLGHINRSVTQYTGGNIAALLAGSPTLRADAFAQNSAPSLRTLLEAQLE